jgi:hypothetical protein
MGLSLSQVKDYKIKYICEGHHLKHINHGLTNHSIRTRNDYSPIHTIQLTYHCDQNLTDIVLDHVDIGLVNFPVSLFFMKSKFKLMV